MEERDYGGAREEMGVCEVSPRADGEGSTGVLRLDRVCATWERQPLKKHGEQSKRGSII